MLMGSHFWFRAELLSLRENVFIYAKNTGLMICFKNDTAFRSENK